MLHISKPSEAKATGSFEKRFNYSLFRLTAIYSITLGVILVISSYITYALFDSRIQERVRRLPAKGIIIELRQGPTPEEVKEDLFRIITIVDIYLFLVAILLSYILARNSLKPLKTAYEEQRRFIGDASHELRTPLAIMKLELEQIKDNKSLMEEVDNMTHIVNDLLLLSRIEEGKNYHPVSLSIIPEVAEVLERMQKLAGPQNITLSQSIADGIGSPHIIGDKDVLHRVLSNLVKNAIVYNKEGGSVNVRIAVKDDQTVTIAIQDTGIGIRPEDLTRIFDRFYRADKSRSRQTGGSGLGLAIAHKGIERLGGSVSVESELGKGTSITISLPKTATS